MTVCLTDVMELVKKIGWYEKLAHYSKTLIVKQNLLKLNSLLNRMVKQTLD